MPPTFWHEVVKCIILNFEVSHPRCVLFNINITMYELVRTQLYLNMVHGVVIYYQLHVSASILAIIRFTLRLNLLREIYKLYGVLRGGERDLVLQIVGSLKCRNLGWSIDLRCSCCRGAPWSAFV